MQRIFDGMKRIADAATDALKRSAPDELQGLSLGERKRQCIPDSYLEALVRAGQDPSAFDWLLPTTELPGRPSSQVENGFIAARGSNLLAFGQRDDHFHLELCSLAATKWIPRPDLQVPHFALELPLSVFRHATIALDTVCDYAAGPWWEAVKMHGHLPCGPEAVFGVAQVKIMELRRGRFGLETVPDRPAGICWLEDGKLQVWPEGASFELARIVAWHPVGVNALHFCVATPKQVLQVELSVLTCGVESALLRRLTGPLRDVRLPQYDFPEILQHSGLFAARKTASKADEWLWLGQRGSQIVRNPMDAQTPLAFTAGYAMGNYAVLSRPDGDTYAVRTEHGVAATICGNLPAFAELRTTASGPWGIFLIDQAPVFVRLGERGAKVGTAAEIPWPQATFEINPAVPETTIVLRHREDAAQRYEVTAPLSLINSLRAEVEVRQITHAIAQEKPGALYDRWATLRRDGFLLLLLGDAATLLQELSRGTTLAQASQILSQVDPQKELSAEQKKTLEAALQQLTLLAESLPEIKQRFELVSLEMPYLWAQQEQAWLETIFGEKCAQAVSEKEAKRGRELLARTIRSLIAPMQRSLSELEAAIRPVESVLFREEVQKHWSMKARRYGPVAVTSLFSGAAAVASVVTTGGILAIAPVLGIAFNQILIGETEKLLRDREKMLTLYRAIDLAAGWLDLLRRGVEISACEAKKFIENENLRAAQRDRKLFEQCPPTLRTKVLENLRKEVQQRGAEAHRAAYAELTPGSMKRIGNTTRYIAQLSARPLNGTVELEP